jgi:hypothetical protein
MPPLDHLVALGFTEARDFRSPLSVRREPPPDRDRPAHGEWLLGQLRSIGAEAERLAIVRAAAGIQDRRGIALALEISPVGSLDAAKQLEWKRDGIEVLNVVRATAAAEVITVYVPDGGLGAFERRVREYLTVDRAPKKEGDESRPAHANLINSVSHFRRAVFDELWTDEASPPERLEMAVFQVWLRTGGAPGRQVHAEFAEAAAGLQIAVEPGYLTFPGRVVLAARATRAALESALDLLDVVAEIRGTQPSAEFFLSQLRPHEQADWVRNMAARTVAVAPDGSPPYVTLLDTGVNRGHPLLSSLLAEADMHAVVAAWGTADHEGHGSEMAGLTLHGELTSPLSSAEAHLVPHRLESVKVLPETGETPVHLYGWVADEAVRLVEAAVPNRVRTFATMTTALGPTAGMPSEWSSTIDRLGFGLQGDSENDHDLPAVVDNVPQLRPRLFVVSAGNIPWTQWSGYPGQNDLEAVEDPGQAWNALTVGAYTERTTFDRGVWPDLQPIASRGALSPASRTSVMWHRAWPHKPDVVAEGGNGCLDRRPGAPAVVGPVDLRLVTTSHEPARGMLAESGDTSAAAAEVARICAHLQTRYPSYWPETVRALVAHGAGYTPAMRADLSIVPTQRERKTLLGRYGYGRVSMDASLNSETRRPTIVLQRTIVPYVREGGTTRLGKVNLHDLPWPRGELEALGEASVALKITLSYFVQPNPSRRGWQSKFRYQSHGLRFAVRAAAETAERFAQRINRINRDEMGDEREDSMPDPDSEGWLLKSKLRSRGSLHSDVWYGLASELANKSEIAIYPVGGWWKEMGREIGSQQVVRYALVVSLELHTEADVDIYTPIANEIAVAIGNP